VGAAAGLVSALVGSLFEYPFMHGRWEPLVYSVVLAAPSRSMDRFGALLTSRWDGAARNRLGPHSSPDELESREHNFLELVSGTSPAARETYTLLQDFRGILTERKAETLRSWLERAGGSSLAPLRGFARSLEQDMDAVMNALTLPWSN